MTDASPFPQSYRQWRTYITERCGIQLTQTFVDSRLSELRDAAHPRTRQFRERYGEGYLHSIIGWFETARQEVA